MEYVNNKMESDVRKEDGQLSEGEIDTISGGGGGVLAGSPCNQET